MRFYPPCSCRSFLRRKPFPHRLLEGRSLRWMERPSLPAQLLRCRRGLFAAFSLKLDGSLGTGPIPAGNGAVAQTGTVQRFSDGEAVYAVKGDWAVGRTCWFVHRWGKKVLEIEIAAGAACPACQKTGCASVQVEYGAWHTDGEQRACSHFAYGQDAREAMDAYNAYRCAACGAASQLKAGDQRTGGFATDRADNPEESQNPQRRNRSPQNGLRFLLIMPSSTGWPIHPKRQGGGVYRTDKARYKWKKTTISSGKSLGDCAMEKRTLKELLVVASMLFWHVLWGGQSDFSSFHGANGRLEPLAGVRWLPDHRGGAAAFRGGRPGSQPRGWASGIEQPGRETVRAFLYLRSLSYDRGRSLRSPRCADGFLHGRGLNGSCPERGRPWDWRCSPCSFSGVVLFFSLRPGGNP